LKTGFENKELGNKLREYLKICKDNYEDMRNETYKLQRKCDKYSRQFEKKKSSFSSPFCGPGFCGSLVVWKNTDESYGVFGMLGGPLFTDGAKEFVINSVKHHCENCGPRALE
jgi:hypothetical protein